MKRNNEILTELQSMDSLLATIPFVNVFSVPRGYFESLPPMINTAIKNERSTVLPFNLQATYNVPEGYFDQLSSDILGRIRAEKTETVFEETRALSPALSAIGNKNIFTVPEGYFANTLENLQMKPATTARVIEMNKKPGIVRYLAAAAVTGIIGLSLFTMFDGKAGETVEVAQQSAMVQANEIIRNKSFDSELDKISASDIEKYLSEDGQDVNAALVATAAADEVTLPSAEDYIINDNTLTDFLHKINLNN